ncbi:MAG TPA: hypothetical protein DCZ94_21375 [Lentisphaeria bacterium]|nr:MAG: hypothetical protein A2X48_19200 [Lentisphaerae bacterium GWF2_49_21]HBC89497.1 hypothetical protein [Lentisphaeria bacterium]
MISIQGDQVNVSAKKTIDVTKELNKKAPDPVTEPTTAIQNHPVLSCFYPVGSSWQKKEFMAGKSKISITEDPHNSDIPIGIPNVQNISISLQKLLSEWYVMESSNSNILSINGIPGHQAILKAGSKQLVFVDKTPLIFIYARPGTADTKTEHPSGKPEKGEFSLLFEQSTNEFRFKKDKHYILGPSEFCDFKLQNENAWATIFQYRNCNYLRVIHGPANSPEAPVTVDGISAETPLPLFDDSKITVGKHVLFYHTEQDFNIAKHEFAFNPEHASEKLCLLCIDENTSEKYSFALPPAGKALYIGRDSHCEIHIDSKDVSRKHSQVIMYERSALVFDCYSTNGTFVNGEKIAKRMLHPGDMVTFGDTRFMFCYLD